MESEKPTGRDDLPSRILLVVMAVVLLGLIIFLVRVALDVSDRKQRVETSLELGDLAVAQAERLNALSKLVEEERAQVLRKKDADDLSALDEIDERIQNCFQILIEAADLIEQEEFDAVRNLFEDLNQEIRAAEGLFIDRFRKDRYIKNQNPHTKCGGFYCLQ